MQSCSTFRSARAQRHRKQFITTFFEPWASKAHQRPAAFDEIFNALSGLSRQRSNVGEHQNGNVLFQQCVQRQREVGFF